MNELLKEAIDTAGGAAKVAEELGINRISVYEWVKKGRLPADRVLSISQLGGWKYTPHQLSPDIYPNAADGLPTTAAVAA